jgi:hypothetical protein
MAATWTAVVLVCQAGKLRYVVPALRITNFDDGTALSRFAKSLRSCRSQQENGDGTR